MNAEMENVLFQLTGKKTLDDISLIELRKITEAHPYFSVGHLLLSRKLQSHKDLAADSQLQRTALYFQNPSWLHYLLQPTPPAVELPASGDEETKPLLKKVIQEEQAQLARGTDTSIPAGKTAVEAMLPDDLAATEVLIADADEEQYAATTTEEVMQQNEDEEKQKEVIASVLESQLAEFRKPVAADAALPIATEPYHTVDYFASQGIKVDLTQPQDKLGNQLRKFTDWLKQMKSVQPEANDLGTDPEVENMIQGIAKTSNETREIVTETMADVLVKQGKTDKAIQLFIKLSFLNPDKSAYFAAKIEQLKGI